MTASMALPTLHALGQFRDPHVGADRELLDIAALLHGRRRVQLWAEGAVHPWFAARGVRPIQESSGDFPRDGVLLLGGIHIILGRWLARTQYTRVLLRYNIANHRRLFMLVEQLRYVTGLEPEVSFITTELREAVDMPGSVEATLLDLAPFLAVTRAPNRGAFTIGRASRDDPSKHHPDDPALYRMLGARGVRVRVMGGTCLAAALDNTRNVELLPAGTEEMPAFLSSLDAFFYRTGSFYETYGRVVMEAMAAGLPVVTPPQGGPGMLVTHDKTGLVANDQEGLYDALVALACDSASCQRLGLAARADAVARHGPEANEALLHPYLRA